MSCEPGKPCEEGRKRRAAVMALGMMALIFVLLSIASFTSSRKQAIPSAVHYAGQDAVQGKRVFQAYNCMGCHTLLGNGAYFGPDLTDVYEHAGPAWLAAFLPSAGGWPTGPAVQVQLQRPEVAADIGASDLDAYLRQFPGAAERVRRRGGHPSNMPNLPLTAAQVDQLIAFLKYTSQMNTEGWPPKPQTDSLATRWATPMPASAAATLAPVAGATPAVATDPAAQGAALVKEYACTSCHALDASRLVGPGWGGLHGAPVKLADGSTVTADDAYLAESIRAPDAKVVAGFTAGTMPAYAGMLKDDQVAAVVAYLRTLSGDAQ